jgi:hypothetical protein
MKRVPEQAVGVELQQPLALLHVALAPGKILGVARVHQIDLKASRVEDLVQRDPIDAGRLHRDGGHAAVLEPVREPMQVRRETVKPADRVGISIRPDRDVMRAVADVDARGVRMHHLQARVRDPEPTGQLFSLFPIQSGDACGDHVGPPLVSQTRGGPVAVGVSVSPTGSQSSSIADDDRPPCQRPLGPEPCC